MSPINIKKNHVYTALYISDIHFLIDKKIKDSCYQDLFKALKALFKNKNYFMEIYLIGDIIENWYVNASRKLKKKEKRLKKLFFFFERMLFKGGKKIYLIGNHDSHYIRRNVLPKKINRFLTERGWEIAEVYDSEMIVAAHGHQAQYVRIHWTFIAMMLRFLYLVAHMMPKLWKKMDKLYGRFLDFDKNLSYEKMLKYYSRLAKKLNQGNRILISGHTHQAVCIPELKVINTGDWVHSKTFLIQDGKNFSLLKFEQLGKRKFNFQKKYSLSA
jgi:UDP-2,3-diacylglucosamine pyrophosphatase LpxH